ncbi:MAG: hypothetical protein GY737_14225 [Desulfobacteraceae bacterium]|nr:hypothetical protein [Desulfobacteraceae bacterium]
MDRKKMAAATAAVVTYIKTQEEAGCLASGQDPSQGAAPLPAPGFNHWGMAGRSDHMQGRTMMQMRVFK